MSLKLVDPSFMAPEKKKRKTLGTQLGEALETIIELRERIAELEDDLENERQRADEAVDELEEYKRETEEDRDRADSAESNAEEIKSIQEEIAICKWRHELGIPGMMEEIEQLNDEMEEYL